MATALIVVDMLNTYEHEDADPLIASAREVVEPLADLIDRAHRQEMLIVYVNDNFGDWSAGRHKLVEAAKNGRAPELIDPVAPPTGTPFLVKARHSVFYETQLEYMLRHTGTERIILTGQVTEQCIFYSAIDAYVRHFELAIPRDCVAHIDSRLADAALEMMETNMHADLCLGADALDSTAISRG
jgi:nicotinamidase-related amidase